MVLLEIILLGAIAFLMLLCFISLAVDRKEHHPYTMIFFIIGIVTNIVAIRMISHFL